ncbi:hypothetical protein BJX64DRAFT_257313 [Aspergillus heterothallicus]
MWVLLEGWVLVRCSTTGLRTSRPGLARRRTRLILSSPAWEGNRSRMRGTHSRTTDQLSGSSSRRSRRSPRGWSFPV